MIGRPSLSSRVKIPGRGDVPLFRVVGPDHEPHAVEPSHALGRAPHVDRGAGVYFLGWTQSAPHVNDSTRPRLRPVRTRTHTLQRAPRERVHCLRSDSVRPHARVPDRPAVAELDSPPPRIDCQDERRAVIVERMPIGRVQGLARQPTRRLKRETLPALSILHRSILSEVSTTHSHTRAPCGIF